MLGRTAIDMQLLFDLFPELKNRLDESNWDLPYLVAGELASWYDEQASNDLPNAKKRIDDLYRFVSEKPRGKTASDDLITILQVGFFEKLFDLPNRNITIPTMTDKKYLIDSKDYLIQWIGKDAYYSILSTYK